MPWFLLLLSLAGTGCSRLDVADPADGGTSAGPLDANPQPGPVAPDTTFEVDFPAAMDPSLLLSDVDRSETVVLVPGAQVDVIAAALGHPRLTAREKGLLVPARVQVAPDATSLQLSPLAPLQGGPVSLLVSARLKDAQGNKLPAAGRFDYQIEGDAQGPVLVSPAPGGKAPRNLRLVRLTVPALHAGAILALAGPEGVVGAAAAPPGAGPAAIDLCPAGRCAGLTAGADYRLQLDGSDVSGASFSVLDCSRAAPPAVRSLQLDPGAAAVQLDLDWPAQVDLTAAPLPPGQGTADGDEALLDRLCASGGCTTVRAQAACAPSGCGAVAACPVRLDLGALASSPVLLLRLELADDAGNRARLAAQRLGAKGLLPAVEIDEVMAAPPTPGTRAAGQYVELWNSGQLPVPLSRLALQGSDGRVRPVAAADGDAQLAPGARALAVGAGFDPGRYPLPAGLLLGHASTQQVLGGKLDKAGNNPVVLLLLPPAGAADDGPVELSRFPGGGLSCDAGQSFERVHPRPAAGAVLFRCGAVGGSPGVAGE